MSSTRDNTYTNTNNRTFYLSDDVDNESIGKLMWNILYQIKISLTGQLLIDFIILVIR